jgi:hypothetical protein
VRAAARRRRRRPRSIASPSAVGLAFQVVDDVLDVEGRTATLGKTAGKDAAQGQADLRERCWAPRSQAPGRGTLRGDAHAALAPFGARGARLRNSPTSSCCALNRRHARCVRRSR